MLNAIGNKDTYLTPAAAVLAVEARHTSYLRSVALPSTPALSPFPKAFDTPLNFRQVYSILVEYVTSFGEEARTAAKRADGPLPLTAFPPLKIQPLLPGSTHYVEGGSGVVFLDAYSEARKRGSVTDYTDVYAVIFSGLDVYYGKVARDYSGNVSSSTWPPAPSNREDETLTRAHTGSTSSRRSPRGPSARSTSCSARPTARPSRSPTPTPSPASASSRSLRPRRWTGRASGRRMRLARRPLGTPRFAMERWPGSAER